MKSQSNEGWVNNFVTTVRHVTVKLLRRGSKIVRNCVTSFMDDPLPPMLGLTLLSYSVFNESRIAVTSADADLKAKIYDFDLLHCIICIVKAA